MKLSRALPTPMNSSCAFKVFAPPPTPPARKWSAKWPTSSASPASSSAFQMRNQSSADQIRAWRLVAFFVGLCFSATAVAQQDQTTTGDSIYVGILDDAREEMRNWKPGVAEHRLIMPAFEKNGLEWRNITSFLPDQVSWTVAFDGKNLGRVESKSENTADQINSNGSRAKQAIVTPSSDVPSVGKPSEKFAGVFSFGPTKFRRPLVVVSKPYFSDPDGWKRAQLP